jgi:arylsulfate sulfotransferase
MKQVLRRYLWLVYLLLAACGRTQDVPESLAAMAHVNIIEQTPGVSPFISRLTLGLDNYQDIKSISYTIAPRPGTFSRPVSVTYEKAWLDRNNAYDSAPRRLALPIFGLYANYRNDVLVTATFSDGSSHAQHIPIQTAAYTDKAAMYGTPTIRVARSASMSPGFDFIQIQNGMTTPVVIDTDGNLRWVATGPATSVSSLFTGDGFFVGSGTTPELYRLELSGALTKYPLASPALTNFHHDLSQGKVGMLGELDANDNGQIKVESILAELSPTGQVLKQWDMGAIFRDFMRAHGDDPDGLVREGADWFHMNSAIYDAADNALLVSSRENFVVKLDYETGEIKWLLGDPTKHWYVNYPSLRSVALKVTNGNPPIGQHSLSLFSDGTLLLFNNGTPSLNQLPGIPNGATLPYSAPVKYAIDEVARTASAVWTYEHDRNLVSDICSSVEQAGSDRYLVTYSVPEARTRARLIGVDTNGKVAFDFEYPTYLCQTAFLARPIDFWAVNFK